MRSEIRSLQRTLSITTVYVTHDQEEAMAVSDHIAVMNAGKITQIGTAEDLYTKPASTFVAQFIGRINILPAEVKEVREKLSIVNIFNQPFQIPKGAIPLAHGQKINVFIRPESIDLVTEVREGQLKGRIVEKTFLGEKVDYQIEIAGHSLNATSYDPFLHETFALDQEVGITLNEKAIKILTE
jgi:iron(III) transport system ATP-binding protein